MPYRKLPPKELRHLPRVWLDALEKQCGGDWRRVYLDADGVPIVGNMAREELPPQGATARKMRAHRKPTNGAHAPHEAPTPKVMAGKTAPPTPKGLKKPPVTPTPPPPPQTERTFPSLDDARNGVRRTGFREITVAKVSDPGPSSPPPPKSEGRRVPPVPPLPEPEPADETPCNICGLVGAHRRSCYNGLVAISDMPAAEEAPTAPAPPVTFAPPSPTPPAAPLWPENMDELLDEAEAQQEQLDLGELTRPEPTVTRRVVAPPTPMFQPPPAPPAITINGRDLDDLPLREAPREERERRRDGRPVVTDDTGKKWVLLQGIAGTNWEGLSPDDVILTAHQVWLKLHEGIPAEASMYWHDDVTNLGGVDLDMVESVARKPARVEIAPETGAKKYPVLRFWRGDVCTVVGFRDPTMPMVIAAYVSASAYNQYVSSKTDQVGGKTGGGGARKSVGIPRRARTLEKRLVDMGAEVKEETERATGVITATVTYKGEEIGKYKVHPCTPKQIETDWQRLQRQITARWQRELAGKVGV